MSAQIQLKGITWNHSRGYLPVTATAQRFMELNPFVEIVWKKRSLQEFADGHMDQLTDHYDLLVVDHPWIGYAAENRKFLPLTNHIPANFLEDLALNSVGRSFESYQYKDELWALPIDAAAPVACYRSDLMEKAGIQTPRTFDQLLSLARKGQVIVPGIPVDTLMNFFMLCASLGEEPFEKPGQVISDQTGLAALELLKNLFEHIDPSCFHYNPIEVYEILTNTDDFIYCPFAYGYSNYARTGYGRNVLQFSDMVDLKEHMPLRSTLGGTGLAVSVHCRHPEIAFQYLQYVSSPECQEYLYFENGGQPAHLGAWKSAHTNGLTGGFFSATLAALSRAYLRPTYNGYIRFQDHAGGIIRQYLMKGGSAGPVLTGLHQLLKSS